MWVDCVGDKLIFVVHWLTKWHYDAALPFAYVEYSQEE